MAFKCEMVEGKLVCGKTSGSKSCDDDNDDDDDKPKKSKDKVIPETCGKKVNCEAGFVKLEKPNKYGACCEAREGLPPPQQQEAEKCKFPGEVGTPPNCSCPPGTVLAERPRSPSERCVKVNSSPPIPLERTKKIPCPEGQIGTPPFNCRCPPGLAGPECNQPIVR